MDKQTATKIIVDTFNYPFNDGRFRHFTRNLLNDIDESKVFERKGQIVPESYRNHIKKYKRIGKYTDPDNNELDVLIIHLRRETSLERARTMQRNFTAWYLKNHGEKDAALVAYHTDNPDDWRFSFIRMEYKQEVTESGKIKVEEDITPARRYSFLVGKNEPNHTAQEQLIPILKDDYNNPTLSEIEKAFSVEKVTKKFYLDYRNLFENLTKKLNEILDKDYKIKTEFETKSIDQSNFTKKLMGQIVFLYFLQKKGWLGVGKDEKGDLKPWGSGPKNFLRQLFEKKLINYRNFFNDVLEPLFYEALALEHTNNYYSLFDCKIPFLNGGLFEPINDYNWQETDILLPNNLFSNTIRTKDDDIGTGILDVFDRYNFTVREDEPLEKEVAVDPEMLGKVFENLLPENLRKGKGTYYTPREIVYYMCQESLINYLDTEVNTGQVSLATKKPIQEKIFEPPEPEQMSLETPGYKPVISRKDIEEMVRKGEFALEYEQTSFKKFEENENYSGTYGKPIIPKMIRFNAPLIDEKLRNIKVCDPAVGSGAFLVGMMHEIVKIRRILKEYIRENERLELYDFKRHCIQECIYGVDIDTSAIEIAKLRLWLSLVVDEEDYYNIKPLPNLEYKIMQGNSLIEEFNGISLDLKKKDDEHCELFEEKTELDRLITKLHHTQSAHFNAMHPGEKNRLKKAVENTILDIFHYELIRQKENYFNELKRIETKVSKISNNEERKKQLYIEKAALDKRHNFNFEKVENELQEMTHGNKERPFFPWRLYFADIFREKGGFDVVIANPPYNELRDLELKKQKDYKNSAYYKYALGGRVNLFQFFYPLAITISRRLGIISLITQNSILAEDSALTNRRFIVENSRIIRFVSFPERDDPKKRVFENSKMSVCIGILNATKHIPADYNFEIVVWYDRYFKKGHTLSLRLSEIKSIYPIKLLFPISTEVSFRILKKIKKKKNVFYVDAKSGEIDITKFKSRFNLSRIGYRVFTGAQVLRYRITDNPSQGEVLYLDTDLSEFSADKRKHIANDRIVMQRITGVDSKIRLIMTIIPRNTLCANSTN